MSIQFYYSPHSSASTVHWTLEELGIPYEKNLIDLKAGQQRQPEFLKLNPNGRVPLLVHDGVPIFESAAIQIYLGELFGVEKGIYPAPGPKRGQVMQWIVWANVTLGDALSRFGRNLGTWHPEDERNAKAGAAAKADIADCLKILEQALTGHDYLTGGSFTIADLHLTAWLDYLKMMSFDLDGYPQVAAWVARCIARPAYALAP
jgi:glutathione S-transferase